MTDWHSYQLTGTPCAPRNCAAAALADAIAAATGGRLQLTGDQVRARSGVSCVKGVHSPSGGLFISDVIRVATSFGVPIDYGVTDAGYTRWAPPVLAARLARNAQGAVLLGDYDALPVDLRAPGSTFLGDHSAFVHDARSDETVCWHDPLRRAVLRIPISAALAYWQKPASPVRGLAGFVTLPAPPARLHYRATVTVATALWNPGTARWVYNGPNRIKVGTALVVRSARYTVGGVSCYPVSSPYGGYFVPAAHVKLGARV